MKVLVTSGATREPIDSVRFISNLSSGRTGAAICETLATRGHEVTQLQGIDSASAAGSVRHRVFSDHASLDGLIREELGAGGYDALIHAAAVGDFTVADAAPGNKLRSGQELTLRLQPTAKIIDSIRGADGGRNLTLVGFKLTHAGDPALRARAAKALLARCGADYVVQNDVTTLAGPDAHDFVIHARGGGDWSCTGRSELAQALVVLLEQSRSRSPA